LASGARFRSVTLLALGALAVAVGGVVGCAGDPAVRAFSDRAIAWQEHDSEDVPRPPKQTDLGDLDSMLIMRDDVAGEVDRAFALEGEHPARDVNAADEVPCSTWFCPRNHLAPMAPEAIAAGPAGVPPRPSASRPAAVDRRRCGDR